MLCRHEGIAQSLYYSWSKEFLEASRKRLAGDTAREASTGEVKATDFPLADFLPLEQISEVFSPGFCLRNRVLDCNSKVKSGKATTTRLVDLWFRHRSPARVEGPCSGLRLRSSSDSRWSHLPDADGYQRVHPGLRDDLNRMPNASKGQPRTN